MSSLICVELKVIRSIHSFIGIYGYRTGASIFANSWNNNAFCLIFQSMVQRFSGNNAHISSKKRADFPFFFVWLNTFHLQNRWNWFVCLFFSVFLIWAVVFRRARVCVCIQIPNIVLVFLSVPRIYAAVSFICVRFCFSFHFICLHISINVWFVLYFACMAKVRFANSKYTNIHTHTYTRTCEHSLRKIIAALLRWWMQKSRTTAPWSSLWLISIFSSSIGKTIEKKRQHNDWLVVWKKQHVVHVYWEKAIGFSSFICMWERISTIILWSVPIYDACKNTHTRARAQTHEWIIGKQWLIWAFSN